jgi:radical SAM protein with 4Fe4S-binding SPASM domain
LAAINAGNFGEARALLKEVFQGVSGGRNADPGMAGSLLYHMAMVTKMAAESRFLLEALKLEAPDVEAELSRFYYDFWSDVEDLGKAIGRLNAKPKGKLQKAFGTDAKITLFNSLAERTATLDAKFTARDASVKEYVALLFQEWAENIIAMRLRQEYETIKGLLVTSELAKNVGVSRLHEAMSRVQARFGEETVNIALGVTLKVGMKREKLQSVMLSDHFINYTMDMGTLEGSMQFLNCPIYGSHRYLADKLAVSDEVASLFCRHFCYAHAHSMLEAVLPFTFMLSQPQRMATNGKCEFHLELARSLETPSSEKFIPLVMSWNITRKCNLKCSHCYINADNNELCNELTTEEAKQLIDQISEVSRPLLILSGGEPLLRRDVFELIRYGAGKGLRMGLGSNGALIDDSVAKNLKAAGVKTVSISLDSSIPQKHDDFRGVEGSWRKAICAIKALREKGVLVQVNTTVTRQNLGEIDEIMSLAERLGVENFHLFFLVPTGRGAKLTDISPSMYENMIRSTFANVAKHKLNVRPSCAPQFMRIAKDMGLDMRQWIRGCIAGLYYCRVYPNGDITPCPYLPIRLGNVLEKPFKEIWFNSEVFKSLRDVNNLKGKCGVCEYRSLCGGCRARAYGLSSDFIDFCGDLRQPAELKGDYLTEDPWCVYQPKALGVQNSTLS